MTYAAKVHKDGPDELVVEEGGVITAKAGATIYAQAGSTVIVDGVDIAELRDRVNLIQQTLVDNQFTLGSLGSEGLPDGDY